VYLLEIDSHESQGSVFSKVSSKRTAENCIQLQQKETSRTPGSESSTAGRGEPYSPGNFGFLIKLCLTLYQVVKVLFGHIIC
jgi:hypothetical protein